MPSVHTIHWTLNTDINAKDSAVEILTRASVFAGLSDLL